MRVLERVLILFLAGLLAGAVYGAYTVASGIAVRAVKWSVLPCIKEWGKDNVTLSMEATAYTAGPESTGKSPGHPAYGITKSGTTVKEGRTIAVDPDLIPLGTHLEVWYKGVKMGDYIAEDTGGLIKGCIIDLYYDELQDALNWGRRQVEVRVPLEAVLAD